MLHSQREMVDGTDAIIIKCPAATRATTPGEAKPKRVEASPLYLRGRVEREDEMPEVEVAKARGKLKGRASGGGDGDAEASRELW